VEAGGAFVSGGEASNGEALRRTPEEQKLHPVRPHLIRSFFSHPKFNYAE